MKSSTKSILYKSVKFSRNVVIVTALIAFLAAPKIFGTVLITPSLMSIVIGYGVISLLLALLYNSLRTLVSSKKDA